MSLRNFVPTGVLGFVLCLVVWRTGSIYPAMLMHFLNNAVSVALTYYPEQIGKVFPVLYQSEFTFSDIMCLVGAGLVLTGVGVAVLCKAGMRRESVSGQRSQNN